jgi:hypothetical protein
VGPACNRLEEKAEEEEEEEQCLSGLFPVFVRVVVIFVRLLATTSLVWIKKETKI